MKDFTVIIPARRNSKSIPFKNRQKVNGLTLVEHTIKFSEEINAKRIILSTDDEFYLDNPKYSKFVLNRPPHLATDEAIISDVILQIIEVEKLEEEFILLLEPTSLPRYKHQLNQLFNGDFENSKARSLASFCKSPLIKEKIWTCHNDQLVPDPEIWKRRQDYPDQFILTGHYFGFYGKDVKKYYPGLCDEKVFPIMIKDKFSDINTYAELNQLRCILNEEENNNE